MQGHCLFWEALYLISLSQSPYLIHPSTIPFIVFLSIVVLPHLEELFQAIELIINNLVVNDKWRMFRGCDKNISDVVCSVEITKISHLDIFRRIFDHAVWITAPIVVVDKIVVKRQIVKVRTEAMRSNRIRSRCWLWTSPIPHSEVLMAVVNASSFVSTRVDTCYVLRRRFWVKIVVKSRPCNKTINDLLVVFLWIGYQQDHRDPFEISIDCPILVPCWCTIANQN